MPRYFILTSAIDADESNEEWSTDDYEAADKLRDELRECGVIHNDWEKRNIIKDKQGRLHAIDFGMSQLV